jgi:hypothetical protein
MARTKTTFAFVCLTLLPPNFPHYGECHETLEEEEAEEQGEKEEEEKKKFLKDLLTSDIRCMSKMVYLSIIMLKTVICLNKTGIKEHKNVLWILIMSNCIWILWCIHYMFIVG